MSKSKPGRNSRIDDEAFAQAVAQAYIEGKTQERMAQEFNCNRSTIKQWIRDPRVLVHIKDKGAERVGRITRTIDRELEKRILNDDHLSNMDTELLLRLRRELLGPASKQPQDKNDDAVGDIWDVLDGNPEMAEAFSKMLTPHKGENR